MRKVFGWIMIVGVGFWLRPIEARAIVADHTSVEQFSSLSREAVNAAANYKVLMMRASTGGYISEEGLGCLAGQRGDGENYPQECVTYANNRSSNSWPWYDRSKWSWTLWPESVSDAMAKLDQFVSQVGSVAGSYDVIGMKYCYVDGWNQSENVSWTPTVSGRPAGYYINKMLDLEARFPSKKFIWATSALWADPGSACGGDFNSCQGISEFNQQVRAYAKANNKLLYDIADIESDGGTCKVGGYEGMCQKYYANGGGHPNAEASIKLAKGFWWLMAKMTDGSTVGPTNTPIPTATSSPRCLTCSNGLAKSTGNSNCDGSINMLDFATWYAEYQTYRSNGNQLRNNWSADFNCDQKVDMLDFATWYAGYVGGQ